MRIIKHKQLKAKIMKNLSKIFSIIFIVTLIFSSCEKDESIKPAPPISTPVASTCVSDTAVYMTIYFLNIPTPNCFAVVKCTNGIVLGDTLQMSSTSFAGIPNCTSSLMVPPSNNGLLNLDSTNPNTIQFYEGSIMIAELSIDATGATSVLFTHPSIAGATFCSPDYNGENGIYIYR